MRRILDDVLSSYPEEEKRSVPNVIHIDQHGEYSMQRKDAFPGDSGKRYLEDMRMSIGSLAISETSMTGELHNAGKFYFGSNNDW